MTAGRDAAVAFAAVLVLVTALVRIDVDVPLVGHLGSALVAVTLLYAPVVVAWKRDEDLLDYGFHVDPLGRGLLTWIAFVAIVAPPFVLGYPRVYDLLCHSTWLREHRWVPPECAAFQGHAGPLRLTWDLAEFCAVQLIVVALPEELFFRGMLLELLERRFPPRIRIAGGGVGLALVLSSAAFALIHLPRAGDPWALATFFPGMVFGWMRSSSRSILAPTLAHASSNILAHVLDAIYLVR